jgi:hypothetical protein
MNDFVGSRPTGIDWKGAHYGLVQYGEDSRLVVIFYQKSVRNEAKTREAQHPIFEDQVYITIHEPGERLNKVDRPATEHDRQRFPQHWANFLQKAEQRPEGTPIDLLFPNSPAIADMLKACGIFTIQQCANLSANAIDNVGMGAQEYVNMAERYLKNAVDGKAFHEMQEENKQLKQDNKILNQRFDMLQKQFDALHQMYNNPNAAQQQPSWQAGHDAGSERINLNHPSQELVKKGKKVKEAAE